jgi:hypothetical protein
MHPPVYPRKIKARTDEARQQTTAPSRKGVEQSDLYVGVAGKAQEQFVFPRRVQVIDQQSDANTAHRSIPQSAHQRSPRVVISKEVVLNIQAARSKLGEFNASRECVWTVWLQSKTRATVRRELFVDDVGQRSSLMISYGQRFRARKLRWQAGTSRQHYRENQCQ